MMESGAADILAKLQTALGLDDTVGNPAVDNIPPSPGVPAAALAAAPVDDEALDEADGDELVPRALAVKLPGKAPL